MTLRAIIEQDVESVFLNLDDSTAETVTHYPQGDVNKKRTFRAQVFFDEQEGDRDQPGDGRALELEHGRELRTSALIEVPTSMTFSVATDRPDVFEFESFPGQFVLKREIARDFGMKALIAHKKRVMRTRRGNRSE